MAKKIVIKKNSEKYREICHMFCEKFVKTFGETSGMTYEQIEKLFKKRIKKIIIGKSVNEYDFNNKKIHLRPEYSNFDNGFEHTFTHEALHAISAVHKRRTFFKSLKSLIFKSTSDFPIDEGITEYYNCCMENNAQLSLMIGGYTQETITMGTLEKFIGSREMMSFYLNNDQSFINKLNKAIPKGYSKIKKTLRDTTGIFKHDGFDENNLNRLAPFRNLMIQTFSKPVTSIESFKEQANLLIEVYLHEIYAVANRMYYFNNAMKKTNDVTQKQNLTELISRKKNQFNELKKILKVEWDKLNIHDETQFNKIVLEIIKEKHPYIYSPLVYSNIFPIINKKTNEEKNTKNNSYSFTYNPNNQTNEYQQEEPTKGRGR